jgi:hypothetical protein
MGSAWATFIGYGLMMVFSWIVGQKFYKIPYNLIKIVGYLGLSVFLYYLTVFFRPDSLMLRLIFHSALLVIFLVVAAVTEKRELKAFFSK